MMSKKITRLIAIVLALLMILSAVVVLSEVLAVGNAPIVVAPKTGDMSTGMYIAAAVVGALAVFSIVFCLVLPKLKKKSIPEDDFDVQVDEVIELDGEE